MDKTDADRIITSYMPKLYGFALAKTGDSQIAEELASDIVYEVYLSLLRGEEIYHIDAYIRRIASFVYARYMKKKKCARERGGISSEDITSRIEDEGGRWPSALMDTDDPAILRRREDERAEHADDLRRMRREIAYLDKTQRAIIVAHYYGGQTVREIAASMGLPEGTVKWHLFDARKTIQEGMEMERNKGKLGYNPIRFSGLSHCGTPGSNGATETHFSTVLAQNIAYAAYDEPKTEAEIAEELGVSPVYLEEIIRDLEEYAFITRMRDGRLRTDDLSVPEDDRRGGLTTYMYAPVLPQN